MNLEDMAAQTTAEDIKGFIRMQTELEVERRIRQAYQDAYKMVANKMTGSDEFFYKVHDGLTELRIVAIDACEEAIKKLEED